MVHTLDLGFLQTDETIASFLIETSAGPVLVETGPHSTLPGLEKGLAAHGFRLADIQHVFLSHIHFDHAGAAWALAEAGAQIYVHPAGYGHLQNPTKLYSSAQRIYGDQMERLWGLMKEIPEEKLTQVSHGQSFEIGDTTFRAWHTPGHAVHHIAWQMGDTVFAGDVAGVKIGTGPVVAPCPPPDIFHEAWLDSIQTIRDLAPRRIMLTHFGEVTDVDTHFTKLTALLQNWVDWMKGPFERGEDPKTVTPVFQAYVADQMREAGLTEQQVAQYEAANPSWMSVAGLLRYWKKRESLLEGYVKPE